jgi:hypothetical protein
VTPCINTVQHLVFINVFSYHRKINLSKRTQGEFVFEINTSLKSFSLKTKIIISVEPFTHHASDSVHSGLVCMYVFGASKDS